MNELVAADRHPDVRGAGALRAEEDQVAGLDGIGADFDSLPELLADRARDTDAVLSEHVPDEATAIEPRRVAAAVAVGRATQCERGADDGIAVAVGGRAGRGGGGAGGRAARCPRGSETAAVRRPWMRTPRP